MLYNELAGVKVSALGMGNMRLPTSGERGPIDEARAQAIIDRAMELGVNYYDTAFGYHAGQSEVFIGKALAGYPRDNWHLASKFPGHMLEYKDGHFETGGYLASRSFPSLEAVFEEQLRKCGVEYFDFFLLHNLNEGSYGFYTSEQIGVVEYLVAQKKAGRIRHLGLSAHARADTLDRFLKWCGPGVIEFVQLQLNYLDWTLQDARGKYEVVTGHGLPVVVMEPVRGGSLADLGPQNNALLKEARPDASIASWAFRWLQGLPQVPVVLSGMTTLQQLEENAATFAQHQPLSEGERQLIDRVVAAMGDFVPCTACRYCCDNCPQQLDIPKLISMYNEARFDNRWSVNAAMAAIPQTQRPGACVACGACTSQCPQNIDIPGVMKDYAGRLAR